MFRFLQTSERYARRDICSHLMERRDDNVVEGSFEDPRLVTLKWFKPIPYSELDRWLDEYYEVLYFVYQGKGRQARTRFYLGQAYSQDIVQRLKHSEHKIHGIAKEQGHVGLKVSFGELKIKEGRKISSKLVNDIENLLIYVYEPKYNERGIWSYSGRHLVIKNTGRCTFFDKKVDSRYWIPPY